MSGVKESMEVLDFALSVVEELKGHMADDGKLDMMEVGQALMANVPEAVRAVLGADEVPEEVSGASEEEQKLLLEKAGKLAAAVVALVAPSLASS